MPESDFIEVDSKRHGRSARLPSLALAGKLCLTLVVILEVGLRVLGFGDPPRYALDPEIEYYLVPNVEYRRFGRRIRINASGMRGNEISANDEGGLRVLLLGDSIVHGTHRVDQDDSLPVVLQTELERRNGCTVEVAAAAVSSWGPVNQAAFLRRFGHFGAEVVVWILSSHDLYDVPVPGYADALPRDQNIRYSAIADAVLMFRQQLAEYLFATTSQADAKATTQRAIAEIRAYMKAHGVPLVVVQHPTKDELVHGRSPAHDEIGVLFADGVPLFQLEPALRVATESAHNPNYADSIHLSKEGVRAVSTFLSNLLAPWILRAPVDRPECSFDHARISDQP
jgi:hypothetical protein